jgi:hypothetical protein
MKQAVTVFLASLLLLAVPMASAQQMQCGSAKQILSGLQARFGEVPVLTGVMASGAKVTMTGNPDTGTWSILFFPDPNNACMVANGDGLNTAEAPKPGNPS